MMFLGDSLRAFWLVSFALGAIVAGQVANRITLYGDSLATFKHIVIGLAVFVLILFAGPLTMFIGKLRETKRRAGSGVADGRMAGNAGGVRRGRVRPGRDELSKYVQPRG